MPSLTYLIRDAVLTAIEQNSIERDRIAQLIVGPSCDRHTLLLWSRNSWEDCSAYTDCDALAEIVNADWLDRVDALITGAIPAETREPSGCLTAPPRIDLGDLQEALVALWKGLRVELQSALRELATCGELGDFRKVVGLMEHGMSVSTHADLVAFTHPLGSGTIRPIRETRSGGTSIYPYAVFHPEGITMFYPEGEQDSPSEAVLRTYAFADMESWCGDDKEAHIRMRGDRHDIHMTAGHRHDEWCGPDGNAISALLLAHLGRHPELVFDAYRMPNPTDDAAVNRWLATYNQQNRGNGRTVVRNAYEEFGEAAARVFLEGQSSDAADRGDTLAALADRLFADRQFAKTLELIVRLDGQPRLSAWREEIGSLLLLQRWDEALERGERIAAADSGKRAGDILPFRAMALSGLGRHDEASALLAGAEEKERGHEHSFAEAFLFRHLDVGRARAALVTALQGNERHAEWGPLYLEDCPELLELLAERARLQQQRELHDGRVAELMQQVTPEVQPLELFDATAAGFGSSPAGESERWRAIARVECDRSVEGSYKKLVLDPPGTSWVPTQTGGLTGFDLADSSQPRVVHTVESETILEDGCRVGRWFFAADDRTGLSVIDLDSRTVVAHPSRSARDELSAIAAGDGFVAVVGGRGAELYDVTTPEAPEILSMIGCGPSHANDVAISGDTLLMAAGAGLVVADVSDPRHPHVVAALCRADREYRADAIHLIGHVAVLAGSGEAWFLDVTNPAEPRSLCVVGDSDGQPRLEAFAANAAGNRLVACDENLPFIWSIDLDDRGWPLAMAAHPTVNAAGEPERFFNYRDAALLPDGRLAALTSTALVVFERESVEATVDVTAPMRAAEAPLWQWALDRLADHARDHADTPIGALALSIVDDSLEISLQPACSIASLEAGSAREAGDAPESYEIKLSGLLGLPPDREEGDDDRLGFFEECKAQAWIHTIDTVLRALRNEPALRDYAAGRVYLVRRTHDHQRDCAHTKLVDILVNDTKPWQPHRRVALDRGPEILGEELNDPSQHHRYQQIAREDETVRVQILALAREGHVGALQVAWSLRELDEQTAMEAFLAADAAQNLTPEVISTLGRSNDDRLLATVCGLLDNPEGDHRHADLAVAALAAMSGRNHEVLPSLRGWVERADENDHRLPGVCRQLFRAGHWELPEKILPQSRREKRGEQYAKVRLGIERRDDSVSQAEACASERLFTSRMLVDRAVELREQDDFESSLWPPELPLEPWPASWAYVLAPALPLLKLYGELDRFVARLVAHAIPGDRYAADRALLLAVADYYEDIGNHAAWRPIAEAVLQAADGFDIATVQRIRDRNRKVRLQEGWDLVNTRDLTAARAIAEQAVADEPTNGQVLYFDARLCWLEHETPEAGIERAKTHLEMLGHDPLGCGRLLHLIGCAFDELGQVHEALPYFERAAQAHPEEPKYLANIAECHQMLGNTDLAVLWAGRALARGAKSSRCETIAAQSS
jgi:tetratricopeptide (TPR) repeat protein